MIDKGQWREIGQDTGVTPLLFTRSAMGFLMTTESQDPRRYTGALGPTQTTGWAPPAGLTNTSSNSNLVFPGGLPSRYWPGSTLLSFSGQPVLGCRVIWLWHLIDLLVFDRIHDAMCLNKMSRTSSRNIGPQHQKYSSIFHCTHGVLFILVFTKPILSVCC